MVIKKASKQKQKARLLFYGLSGAGKTRNALEMARLLTSEKIVVIDSENETSSLYSDIIDFDILPVESPFSLEKLGLAFKEAEAHVGEGGVIIIDTLSKFWDATGGALDEVNNLSNGNKAKGMEAWGKVTPKIARVRELLTGSKTAHVIVTCRVKSETIMEEYTDWQGKTKTKAVKVGLAPVFKDGIEYDYDIALEFNLLVTKTGKEIQVLRNTKPPRIPYFVDLEAVIPPNSMEGMRQWDVQEAAAQTLFFLDQGVDPKLAPMINRFTELLKQYKEVSGKDHKFAGLDLNKLTEEEFIKNGKELKQAVDKLNESEPTTPEPTNNTNKIPV